MFFEYIYFCAKVLSPLLLFSYFSLDIGCFLSNLLSSLCTWPFPEECIFVCTFSNLPLKENNAWLIGWNSVVSTHNGQFSKEPNLIDIFRHKDTSFALVSSVASMKNTKVKTVWQTENNISTQTRWFPKSY